MTSHKDNKVYLFNTAPTHVLRVEYRERKIRNTCNDVRQDRKEQRPLQDQ